MTGDASIRVSGISMAQRLFGVPLLLHPARAVELARYLSERQGLEVRVRGDEGVTARGRDRPYEVADGIARVPIEGTLVHKSGYLDAVSGLTGYDKVRSIFDAALADLKVRGIALMVNSPGGEVSGLFDLVDHIYAARGEKPIWSILDESAYSAAYALASSAEVVTVPRTGGTGSIGAVAVHAEYSRQLDKAGVTVTVMRHGEKKARANDVEPLRDTDQADLQEDIDRVGKEFIRLVARNRNLERRAVREQEAATFMGESGVDRGLADLIASPETAFQLFQETING
jgi:signal peptide peptidase SppA